MSSFLITRLLPESVTPTRPELGPIAPGCAATPFGSRNWPCPLPPDPQPVK